MKREWSVKGAMATLVLLTLGGCGSGEKPAGTVDASDSVISRQPADVPVARAPIEIADAAHAKPGDWIALFDGKSLAGWTQRGGKAQYLVEPGGVLLGRTVANTPNSFLCTEATYRDFELELEFKIDAGANSGVQVRSESRSDYQSGRVHGYQIEIDPSERAWTAGLYDEGRRGWLVDLKNNPKARAAFRPLEWNLLRVVVVGDTFNTWLNGVPAVVDFHDSRTAEGFIALQVHSVEKAKDGSTPTHEVRWRNVRLLPRSGPSKNPG
mgnify:CR=1 FL=1